MALNSYSQQLSAAQTGIAASTQKMHVEGELRQALAELDAAHSLLVKMAGLSPGTEQQSPDPTGIITLALAIGQQSARLRSRITELADTLGQL